MEGADLCARDRSVAHHREEDASVTSALTRAATFSRSGLAIHSFIYTGDEGIYILVHLYRDCLSVEHSCITGGSTTTCVRVLCAVSPRLLFKHHMRLNHHYICIRATDMPASDYSCRRLLTELARRAVFLLLVYHQCFSSCSM